MTEAEDHIVFDPMIPLSPKFKKKRSHLLPQTKYKTTASNKIWDLICFCYFLGGLVKKHWQAILVLII